MPTEFDIIQLVNFVSQVRRFGITYQVVDSDARDFLILFDRRENAQQQTHEHCQEPECQHAPDTQLSCIYC